LIEHVLLCPGSKLVIKRYLRDRVFPLASRCQAALPSGTLFKSVYFHHIGKTAGTYLHNIITQALPRWSCLPRSGLDAFALRNLHNSYYVKGHFPFQVRGLMRHPNLLIVATRNPVDHFLSTYNHLFRTEGAHGLLVRERGGRPLRSLDDYLDDDALKVYTLNPQTYSIANDSSIVDIVLLASRVRRVDWSGTCDASHQLLYGIRMNDRKAWDPEVLELALNRLNTPNCVWVDSDGLTKNAVQNILALVSRRDNCISKINWNVYSNNATSSALTRQSIDSSQLAEIESRIAMDIKLHESLKPGLFCLEPL
jgi:hypothetical protein